MSIVTYAVSLLLGSDFIQLPFIVLYITVYFPAAEGFFSDMVSEMRQGLFHLYSVSSWLCTQSAG